MESSGSSKENSSTSNLGSNISSSNASVNPGAGNPGSNITYTKYLEIEQFEDKLIIQDYICPLCTGVYNNPVVDGCGHVFCQKCIDLSMTKTIYCPISYRDLGKDSFHQIPFISSIISKHIINCKNKCGWKKALSFYQAHLDEDCPNVLQKCKFENCKEFFLRSEKTQHEANCEFRLIMCDHCKNYFAFVELDKHLATSCPNVKIACLQDCSLEIERCQMEDHIKQLCENTLVQCVFSEFGCSENFKRKDENSHYETRSIAHLKVLGKDVIQENKTLKQKISVLEEEQKLLQEAMQKLEKYVENNIKLIKSQQEYRNAAENDIHLNESNKNSNGPVMRKENNDDLLNKKRLKPDFENSNSNKNGFMNKAGSASYNTGNRIGSSLKNLIDDNLMDSDVEMKNNTTPQVSESVLKIDKISSSDNLQVVGNKVICNSLVKNQHKFIFAKCNFNNQGCISWNILINKKSGWMGFGVAKKNKVIENKYAFASSEKNFDHGCFLISSNGFFWNSNLKSQNNCKISPDFVEPSTGDLINFKFSKPTCTLEISFNKFTTKLESIFSEKDDIVPCAIMMANGDELTFSAFGWS